MTQDPDGFAVRVAEILQAERKRRGLTLDQLATAAGLHRTSLGLVERGLRKLSLESAKRLADALEVPLAKVVAEAESS